MMRLHVNGTEHDLDRDAPIDVVTLLEELELPTTRGVAVAVNDQVVTRSDWSDTTLVEGDRVEIIRATQGG